MEKTLWKYRVFENTLNLFIGNLPTPLVKLRRASKGSIEVWAKLEFYNPYSRSIKDRIAWAMIKDAYEKGMLKEVIEEASSGNTSLALAALSRIYGRKFRAYLPKNVSETIPVLLRVFGVEYIITDYETIDPKFWDYVRRHAEKIGATNLNQFENDVNFRMHYETTAKEIVEQMKAIGKKPGFIICGTGTSGHVAAISKRVKEVFKGTKVYAVQPARGHSIPGIKSIETKPKWFFKVEIDGLIDVTLRNAIESSIEIARNEGILVGLSSGAVYWGFKKLVREGRKGVFVLVFPDDGFKYVGFFRKYFEGEI